MINSVKNIVGLAFVFFLLIGFVIGLSVIDTVKNNFDLFLPSNVTSSPIYQSINRDYADLKNTVLNGVNFILAVAVLFTFYSSFISNTDLLGYIAAFIGGVVISGILLYVTSSLFNYLTGLSVDIGLSMLPPWFIDNLPNLFLFNIVASGLSFVFTLRRSNE